MLALSDKLSKNGWKQQIITFGNLNLPAQKSHNLHKDETKNQFLNAYSTAQLHSGTKALLTSFLFEVYAIKSSPTLPKTTYSLTICVCATRYSRTSNASLHWSKLQLQECSFTAPCQLRLFLCRCVCFLHQVVSGPGRQKNTRGERLGICVAFCRGKQQTCIWS